MIKSAGRVVSAGIAFYLIGKYNKLLNYLGYGK